MIIQTGNRTDIPAFYTQWFNNRLREGFVLARNPFNPVSVTRYRLDPSVVDLIVFCTKNPGPMLRQGDWDLLNKYHQYWFVTITPYGKDIEPNVPEKAAVMESFRSLSRIVGADCMCWRYDPILIDNTWTAERHIREFSAMCQKLEGSTHTCVISFIDLYEKVRRNYPEAKTVPFETQMSSITGADCSGCMTQETFESAIGQNINLPPNPNNRKECSCYITNDIGQYNTCGHLCRYCYANADAGTVRRNMRMHDPKSPLLVGFPRGFPRPEDRIRDARQESWIDPQMRLDLC